MVAAFTPSHFPISAGLFPAKGYKILLSVGKLNAQTCNMHDMLKVQIVISIMGCMCICAKSYGKCYKTDDATHQGDECLGVWYEYTLGLCTGITCVWTRYYAGLVCIIFRDKSITIFLLLKKFFWWVFDVCMATFMQLRWRRVNMHIKSMYRSADTPTKSGNNGNLEFFSGFTVNSFVVPRCQVTRAALS